MSLIYPSSKSLRNPIPIQNPFVKPLLAWVINVCQHTQKKRAKSQQSKKQSIETNKLSITTTEPFISGKPNFKIFLRKICDCISN
jgi:hypothetical protein